MPELGRPITENMETAEQRTIAKQAQQDRRSEALTKAIAEQQTHFTEMCDRLDNALSDRLDSLTRSADDLRQSSGAASAELERKLQDVIDSGEDARGQLHTHFTDLCGRLQTSIGEKTAEVESKCMDACGRLDRKHMANVKHQADATAGHTQRVDNLQRRIDRISKRNAQS